MNYETSRQLPSFNESSILGHDPSSNKMPILQDSSVLSLKKIHFS